MALCDKFAIIGDKQMNVYNHDTFVQSQEVLIEDDQTALEIDHNGKSLILPVRKLEEDGNMQKPGVYFDDGPLMFVSYPSESEEHIYIPTPDKIFDLTDISSMQEYVTKKEEYDNSITALLETDPGDDSVFRPPLLKTDSPEMRALKESVILKAIDLDKYASRFGVNYPNDKRKFKDDNITSFMLKRICENLDIKVDIVFSDASEDVPNPMGKVVSVNMIPGYDNNANIMDVEHF